MVPHKDLKKMIGQYSKKPLPRLQIQPGCEFPLSTFFEAMGKHRCKPKKNEAKQKHHQSNVLEKTIVRSCGGTGTRISYQLSLV